MRMLLSMRIAGAALAVTLLALPSAFADCGPGPIVTSNNKSIVLQTAGVSTNTFLFPTHTLGITLGTSGCSNSGIVKQEYEQRLFVRTNYDALHSDMAVGQGTALAALADLLGCTGLSVDALGAWTHGHYADLLPDAAAQPEQLLISLKHGIGQVPLLSTACTRIG